LTVISYFIFLSLKIKGSITRIEANISLVKELKYWKHLIKNLWPIVLISFILGLIHASFWTIGAALSENLVSENNFLASLYVPFFMLPTLIMGFILIKANINTNKKMLSIIFLIISGFFLILMGVNHDINWQLLCVLIIGVMQALAWPLSDAVYSDLASRMGNEKKHLMGLSNSTFSVAYIIGPVVAGLFSSLFGEYFAFSLIGLIVLIVSIILLIFTPKKLKLSKDIKQWD
jgi:MFS family permease